MSSFFQKQRKAPDYFSFFMLKDLFDECLFTILGTLENRNLAIILANICVTQYSIIHKEFLEIVCQVLEIEL